MYFAPLRDTRPSERGQRGMTEPRHSLSACPIGGEWSGSLRTRKGSGQTCPSPYLPSSALGSSQYVLGRLLCLVQPPLLLSASSRSPRYQTTCRRALVPLPCSREYRKHARATYYCAAAKGQKAEVSNQAHGWERRRLPTLGRRSRERLAGVSLVPTGFEYSQVLSGDE